MTGGGDSTETKPAGAWGPEHVIDYLVAQMAAGKFYIVCLDDDADEAADKRKRWAVDDIVQGRPPARR